LEILDEITRLRFENTLPKGITGNRRNVIICQFQKLKGTDYVPHNVHHSIRWNKQDPLEMLDVVTDTPWQLLKNSKYGKNQRSTLTGKSNITGFVAASGSVPVGHTQKRKSDHDDTDKIPRKMMKISENILGDLEGPEGFIWDSENYSCAYDSLLTILLSIWSQEPVKWKGNFKDMNEQDHECIGDWFSSC
jgi:hypothetical protein